MNTRATRLVHFADGVWLSTGPVTFLGLRLTTTMVILRLDDGSLLLYSPAALTPERREAIEALGPVRHLYATQPASSSPDRGMGQGLPLGTHTCAGGFG